MERLKRIARDPAFHIVCFFSACMLFSWPILAGILAPGGTMTYIAAFSAAFLCVFVLFAISMSCKPS